ncbi:Piso0_002815 [Millerozyma farinosa CBS 7064]|uniref:Piso0_002815 protein n=1 Tax=Pichia sorbitophila (strain ATCC MYA-4447 / BCRC 22081 / CBS 7064 / NBRC 10061 / NRRL Y-12695) TaxID=559304 RepID=G8YDL0_PICSO|nr:Piso0_002815 [Millerozyma farinosa CBS 7064]
MSISVSTSVTSKTSSPQKASSQNRHNDSGLDKPRSKESSGIFSRFKRMGHKSMKPKNKPSENETDILIDEIYDSYVLKEDGSGMQNDQDLESEAANSFQYRFTSSVDHWPYMSVEESDLEHKQVSNASMTRHKKPLFHRADDKSKAQPLSSFNKLNSRKEGQPPKKREEHSASLGRFRASQVPFSNLINFNWWKVPSPSKEEEKYPEVQPTEKVLPLSIHPEITNYPSIPISMACKEGNHENNVDIPYEAMRELVEKPDNDHSSNNTSNVLLDRSNAGLRAGANFRLNKAKSEIRQKYRKRLETGIIKTRKSADPEGQSIQYVSRRPKAETVSDTPKN